MDDLGTPYISQIEAKRGNMEYANVSKPSKDDSSQKPQIYSMPGILYYLQTEWAKFEMERARWDVERSELQARIAFLQGERKGQENLKRDLVRRIKMLEFALREERTKLYKAKYGSSMPDPTPGSASLQGEDNSSKGSLDEEPIAPVTTATTNQNWKQGRQLLRQYLQEIGYTEAVLDVRSTRVRALLGMQPTEKDQTNGGGEVKDSLSKELINLERPGIGIEEPSRSGSAMLDVNNMISGKFIMPRPDVDIDGALEMGVKDDDDDEDDDDEDSDEETSPEERNRIAMGLPTGRRRGGKKGKNADDNDMDLDTEGALAEFDFLVKENEGDSTSGDSKGDDADLDKKDTDSWPPKDSALEKLKRRYAKQAGRASPNKDVSGRPKKASLEKMLANLSKGEEAEADSTTGPANGGQGPGEFLNYGVIGGKNLLGPGEANSSESSAVLGDLANIDVNEVTAESALDVPYVKRAEDSADGFRKTWTAKYTLRSHFDGVRALVFHPVEPVLLTASEDHTLKLWNLQKPTPTSAKKAQSHDLEPVYTFRAHKGPVLCVAMSVTGEQFFSGGLDSTIRCWNVPNTSADPYDPYDSSVAAGVLTDHSDSVHGLAVHSSSPQLLSCSADSTVRLWNIGGSTQPTLMNTFQPPTEDDGVPTCVDFINTEPNQLIAAYTSGNVYTIDLETGKVIVKLSVGQDEIPKPRVNAIATHPTISMTALGQSDQHIRFFDSSSGEMLSDMVAHLDAVTSLAMDPNGLYLLSGSHDCSIRLWNLESKACIQEITSHRKKFDESIHSVCLHPTKPYIASAGADGLAKVFI